MKVFLEVLADLKTQALWNIQEFAVSCRLDTSMQRSFSLTQEPSFLGLLSSLLSLLHIFSRYCISWRMSSVTPLMLCVLMCWTSLLIEVDNVNVPAVGWGTLAMALYCSHHGWVETVGHAELEVLSLGKSNSVPFFTYGCIMQCLEWEEIMKTYVVKVFWVKLKSVIVVLKHIWQ